jgi:hypothetical protein
MIDLNTIVTNRRQRSLYESFDLYGIDTNRNELLPGHYYSLDAPIENFNNRWIPDNIDEFKESPDDFITDKQFVDLNPIGLIFHHDHWKENALMLNLKVIPPQFRAALIMTHINIIKDSLDRIGALEEDENGNSKLISLNERKKLNLPMYRITPSILEQVSGIKIGYAMSGYSLDRVTKAKLLDWDKIGELPLANIETRGLQFAPSIFEVSDIFNKFENNQLI